MQLATGAWAAGIPGAAVNHSIFTHLGGSALTAEATAKKANLSPRGTQGLLDALVGLGLLNIVDGRYENTLEASSFTVQHFKLVARRGSLKFRL